MLYKPKKTQYINAWKFTTPEESPIPIQSAGEVFVAQSEQFCPTCGHKLKEHGMIPNKFEVICPGTYIIYKDNNITQLMSSENFEAIYKSLDENVVATVENSYILNKEEEKHDSDN